MWIWLYLRSILRRKALYDEVNRPFQHLIPPFSDRSPAWTGRSKGFQVYENA